MKNYLFTTLFALLFCCFTAFAGTENRAQKYTIKDQGIERIYYFYKPADLKPNSPLVVVLHGYGGKADGYRNEFQDLADEMGFAVCVPQGSKDKKNKNCWNVGYPFQDSMKVDDIKFLKKLVKCLQKEHSLSAENTFCTGMSNGGEMCYLLAYEAPETFAAFAPIAGLTMKWMIKDLVAKQPVPLMEVHGTADKTSLWEGDVDDKGGWGAYIAVPAAVANWISINKCTHREVEELPLLSEKSNKVTLHRYLGGDNGTEVWLYEVHGGGHTWAMKDLDTPREIWKFFSKYLK